LNPSGTGRTGWNKGDWLPIGVASKHRRTSHIGRSRSLLEDWEHLTGSLATLPDAAERNGKQGGMAREFE